jgi:hypothetical protein
MDPKNEKVAALRRLIYNVLARRRYAGWEVTDITYDFMSAMFTATFRHDTKEVELHLTEEVFRDAKQKVFGRWKIKRLMRTKLLPNSDTE